MDFVRKKPSVFPTSVLLALCLGFIGGLLFGYCLYLTATLNVPSPELTDTRLSTSKVVYGSIKCPDVPPSVPCEPCVGTVANQTIGCPEVPTCETCEASGNGSGSQQDMAEDEVFVKNLPQNFIHKTTDYHRKNMTKMPYQDRPGPTPKSLLAMAVGFKQRDHVDAYLQKFDEEHFQVVLFHYDNTVDKWRDFDWFQRVVHIQSEGQSKWWFTKRFLHPDVVAPYEYIFVWDEDLNLTNCDPLKFIDIMKRNQLQIAQPAIEGATHWPITKRVTENGIEMHTRTSEGGLKDKPCVNETTTGGPCEAFVEIQAPVFEHKSWRCVWNLLQNDLIMAWGIDFILRECVSAPAEKHMGIIDSQWILHDSAQSLYSKENQTTTQFSSHRDMLLKRSFWEYSETRRRWGTTNATRNAV
ncbi:uncharacterized protein [Physcomitrium patens]|uniref:Uncharacterized protein n=1 Tax=Physcomitrium patens TaxID=3218 RepID=A0A2K1LAV2_PHYPA|nr:uncharacterized protein LOC112280250 [Physcomitrium patens]PNR63141.1 hypothetical protein PHYPA_001566 [Physcomitrium patens]|eukprot:XP_024371309.1 uncharacterized protein LOC112280250 [Physcomitrella patens]